MEVRHDDERKRHSVAFVLTVRASNTSAYARSTKAKYESNVDLCIWTLVIEMRLQVTIKSGEETETSGQPKRIDLEHTIIGGEEKKKKGVRRPTKDLGSFSVYPSTEAKYCHGPNRTWMISKAEKKKSVRPKI